MSFQPVTLRLSFSLLRSVHVTLTVCETMTRQFVGFGTSGGPSGGGGVERGSLTDVPNVQKDSANEKLLSPVS